MDTRELIAAVKNDAYQMLYDIRLMDRSKRHEIHIAMCEPSGGCGYCDLYAAGTDGEASSNNICTKPDNG